jgi:hypothetical protein
MLEKKIVMDDHHTEIVGDTEIFCVGRRVKTQPLVPVVTDKAIVQEDEERSRQMGEVSRKALTEALDLVKCDCAKKLAIAEGKLDDLRIQGVNIIDGWVSVPKVEWDSIYENLG